jgi:hypothetical protein
VPRKLREVERVRFGTRALEPVVDYMDRLSRAGEGWVNLVPDTDDRDDRPTALPFFTLFGGGGKPAAMITWIPPRTGRRGTTVQTVGISHGAGRRARAALAAADVRVPETWTVEQDHPRRGLIVHPPAGEGAQAVLTWALTAVEVLEAPRRWPWWRADVHLPST